jgi:hypothetical protein
MGNDPTLMPSIFNPQQQLLQRIAAMEARMQAQERRRDLIVTPVNELTANGATFGGSTGSMDFEWYSGRVWVVLGGRFYTNGTYVEGTFTPTVKINGVQLTPAPVQGWARPNQGGAFGLAAYSSISNLTVGTNTITATIAPAAQSTVDRAMIDGLIIEWPNP